MLDSTIDISYWNKELRNKTPQEIISWALSLTDKKIVTTSFGVYSAVLLSTISKQAQDIKVVWCDTLFNTPETYSHANNLINTFNLNVEKYEPLLSKSVIDATIGIPEVTSPKHAEFTEVVKLEPFRRALAEQSPELWFTNIRVRQTEYRKSKDILSWSKDDVLKVSPFYYWSDEDLDAYIAEQNLPKNQFYFDPTKALQNRECGIHFQ
ncbi:phosphoadenosine phosphosulfate reductase domain-containing protein [Formosa algae]|uniref:phosphoadenosine phosphosulfate reductase domain-containing protein n=1 Tax=Formosa algae TaxID=225843 RepID=UPI000CCE21BD|nr:phosphoadenosine phosphosulfate reductase family protein [Formosa algae]PNW29948.1 phosphoadenylylsulfate reductase [Formosa algae]